jgi:LmbE family N-acetylglucosaminyl deacetylase
VEAHPDDLVWGCGGTIAKLSHKNQFISVTFTSCNEDPLNKGILEENIKALNFLGVKDVRQNGLSRRTLFMHAQEVRDFLYKIKLEYNPEIIFCASPSDLHQDHSLTGECCKTIFRDSATILAYSILRSLGNFNPICFVELSKKEIKMKLQALSMFKTQYRRPYFKKKVILSETIYYGTQINVKHAEAFEILRWLM